MTHVTALAFLAEALDALRNARVWAGSEDANAIDVLIADGEAIQRAMREAAQQGDGH